MYQWFMQMSPATLELYLGECIVKFVSTEASQYNKARLGLSSLCLHMQLFTIA